MAHNDAQTGMRGTAIYTKENLEAREMKMTHITTTPKDRFTTVTAIGYVFIEAYAPVNSEQTDEREEFFKDLEDWIEMTQRQFPNLKHVIMGDLNAHVKG